MNEILNHQINNQPVRYLQIPGQNPPDDIRFWRTLPPVLVVWAKFYF